MTPTGPRTIGRGSRGRAGAKHCGRRKGRERKAVGFGGFRWGGRNHTIIIGAGSVWRCFSACGSHGVSQRGESVDTQRFSTMQQNSTKFNRIRQSSSESSRIGRGSRGRAGGHAHTDAQASFTLPCHGSAAFAQRFRSPAHAPTLENLVLLSLAALGASRPCSKWPPTRT